MPAHFLQITLLFGRQSGRVLRSAVDHDDVLTPIRVSQASKCRKQANLRLSFLPCPTYLWPPDLLLNPSEVRTPKLSSWVAPFITRVPFFQLFRFNKGPVKQKGQKCTIGALIIRIGFRGPW